MVYKYFHQIMDIITISKLIEISVLVLIVLLIEILFLGLKNSSFKDLFSLEGDNMLNIISLLAARLSIMPFLCVIFTFGGFSFIKELESAHKGHDFINLLPYPLAFIAMVYALDFLNYWIHRMLHRVPFLWEFHKFHHSGKTMNIILMLRMHPVETAIRLSFYSVLYTFLGIPIDKIFIINYITEFLNLLHHSRINWTFGIIGKYLIYSPRAHSIHHSNAPEHFDKNFGFLTPLWDRVFGTWFKGEESVKSITPGVTENYHSQSITKAYLMPYVNIGRAIKNTLRSSWQRVRSSWQRVSNS